MTQKKFRLVTLLGIRPDIIRMFKLIQLLDANQKKFGYEHIYAHTGQHFDQELDGIFYEQLGVRRPDINLEVGKILKEKAGPTSFEYQVGISFPKVLELIENTKPDAIMYLGDTNSVLSSIVAARNNIPVIHLEAGGRSFDWRMPEEKCRTIIDHMSDLLYCYSPRHQEILLSEGIAEFRTKVIGNIIYDAIEKCVPIAESSPILDELKLKKDNYILTTLHREENTSTKEVLEEKLDGLIRLATEHEVVWPLMPRVRNNLEKFGLLERLEKSKIQLTKPLGYWEFLKLQKYAKLIVTDSGTVQEEAMILGVPALVTRLSTERPKTVQAGATILANTNLYDNAKKAMELTRKWDKNMLNPTRNSPSQIVFDDLMERIQSGYFTSSRDFEKLKQKKLVREAYGQFEN